MHLDECPVMPRNRASGVRRSGDPRVAWIIPVFQLLIEQKAVIGRWPRSGFAPRAGDPRRGWLTAGGQTIPVALGRGGIIANKREGDGGTPRGTFRPRQLWWRADRHPRPQTFLPVRAIRPEDAWCEDPTAATTTGRSGWIAITAATGSGATTTSMISSSRSITTPLHASPAAAARYSCIWRGRIFLPTAGCVSMTKSAMLRLLRRLGPQTRIVIG